MTAPARILILDDIKDRHDAFNRIYTGHTVFNVYSYMEFVSYLNDPQGYDLIHLDHDLGDFHVADTYVDGWGKTVEYNGMHAVDRLCEFDYSKWELGKPAIVVHSVNVERAIVMVKTLRAVGFGVKFEPFGDV